MRSHIETRRCAASDDWLLVVTYIGPNGFWRGWSTQYASEADARVASCVASAAARATTAVVDWRPPTHGRIEARPS